MLAHIFAYSVPENTLVLMHCEDSNSPTSVGPMRPPRLATLFMIATPVAAAGPAAIIGQASLVPAHINASVQSMEQRPCTEASPVGSRQSMPKHSIACSLT